MDNQTFKEFYKISYRCINCNNFFHKDIEKGVYSPDRTTCPCCGTKAAVKSEYQGSMRW